MTVIKNLTEMDGGVNSENDKLNFELFFEVSPDLLCIAGYDGYFRKVNPSVVKLLGYTLDELYAKPIHEFIHVDDKERTATHRSKLLNNTPLLNFENRYVTKNGEIVWLSWTSISAEREKIVYAIAKNITYKKKLEEDRNLVIANLARINNDLKLLTATTSHDLRSPVNNLLSIFSILDVSTIQDEKTLGSIEMLKSATELLNETLNQYVDALFKKETFTADIEDVDINESLNSVLQSLAALIHSSKTTVHINFEEVQTIKFNKAYLESIFLNLITNSIKYVQPNHFPVIKISTRNLNGVNQLIFSDEGQGFNMEEVKDKIFGFRQRFHDHIDSKGIGLYLVYNHVTNSGGQIAVESKPNEGTKFIISFKN
jgi:PAS domain S-box-containing protein